MTQPFADAGDCVDAAIRRVGRRIVLALPLGIGKPAAIANEFWRRALREPSLELTIVTALSLSRPRPGGELERRLLEPVVERVFGDFEELDYVAARRAGPLPANVRVIEFFFEPGSALGLPGAQRDYLSSNYTHVARDLAGLGVNVLAQVVARRPGHGPEPRLSLGSNPDVTLDLLPYLAAARARGESVATIGVVHGQMPYMPGSAELPTSTFDLLLEHERYERSLFCPPNPPIGTADHAIGLHVSGLIADGGTLQIGIGGLGEAVCYALLLRHQQNPAWRQALRDVGTEHCAATLDSVGGRDAFRDGLFGCSEMFVDQMLDLYRAGVLRRRVYDSLPLARLVARGNLGDRFDARILGDLPHVGVGPRLTEAEFASLRHFGVFRADCRYEGGRIRSPEGEWIPADLGDAAAAARLAATCLGRELRNGQLLHAGFFLGPRGFYAALRDMPEAERRQFDMRGVSSVNQLYGDDYELRVLQRRAARFVNSTMMVTLLGAAVSDGLEGGRVVSGVGGQYNFVAMAHALEDARSVICLRASRHHDGRPRSNIVWEHAQVTIPRHLRDIVVTEYGIADLRGRTDAECIAALLNVADSRFQPALLAQAVAAGKLPAAHAIPEAFRRNTPAQLERALAAHRRAGLFTEYPFGTDLTEDELRLARALARLRDAARNPLARVAIAVRAALRRPTAADLPLLRRMGLERPADGRERRLRRLLLEALARERAAADVVE
jgi:acyl-CoA hydrolase